MKIILQIAKESETMELSEYQEKSRRTRNKGLTKHEHLIHALCGLASEVGEIHSIYQKAYQGHPVSHEKVRDEMGDVLWMMAELADTIGADLGQIAQDNIDKLWRRYPEGFDSVRSVCRDE